MPDIFFTTADWDSMGRAIIIPCLSTPVRTTQLTGKNVISYDMRNEQICKTINISRRLVLLHIIGDYNFESELNLDQPVFKLKKQKKHLNLQTY